MPDSDAGSKADAPQPGTLKWVLVTGLAMVAGFAGFVGDLGEIGDIWKKWFGAPSVSISEMRCSQEEIKIVLLNSGSEDANLVDDPQIEIFERATISIPFPLNPVQKVAFNRAMDNKGQRIGDLVPAEGGSVITVLPPAAGEPILYNDFQAEGGRSKLCEVRASITVPGSKVPLKGSCWCES